MARTFKILDLYFSAGSSMLPLGGKRSLLGGPDASDALARSVQGLFWSSSPGDLPASLRRGAVVRQRPQVDAGDVDSTDGPRPLPGLPALHHPRALGCGGGLEASALGVAGTAGSAGSGRHRFPQTGPALRRGRSSVLRHPRQDRQLPGGRHGGFVDRGACLAGGRRAVPAAGLAHTRAAGLRVGPRAPRPAYGEVTPGPPGQEGQRRGGRPGGFVAGGACLAGGRRAVPAAGLAHTRAAGLRLDAVLADSAYGDVTAFRTAVERMQLRYAVGISSHLTVFPGRPSVIASSPSARGGRPRKRPRLHPKDRSLSVSALANKLPRRAWRCVSWRNGKNRPWEAEFAAMRVTPAHEWRRGRIAEEVWLLCQRPVRAKAARKFYFSNLPPRARLSQLVRLAHQRWAVEQQYQNLKTELGLDHFQGRSYRGWKHHVVLCAVAYAFLQKERMRPRPGRTLTFPAAHAVVQEVFTGLLFLKHPRYFTWLKKGQRFLQLRM